MTSLLRARFPSDRSSCFLWCHGFRSGHRGGRLCGICINGYSPSFGSVNCAPSESCDAAEWFIPMSLLVGTCLFLYWYATASQSDGLLAVMAYFYQVVDLLFVQTTASREFSTAITHLFDLRLSGSGICLFPGLDAVSIQVLPLATPLFILLPMILAVTLYHFTCTRPCFIETCERLQPCVRCCDKPASGVEPSRLRRLRNTVDDSSRESSLLSPTSVGETSVGDLARVSRSPPASFLVVIINVALYAYSTFVQTTFSLLQCVPVAGESNPSGYIFLAAEVACYQWWQAVLFLFMALLIVFPISILWWIRRASLQRSPLPISRTALEVR